MASLTVDLLDRNTLTPAEATVLTLLCQGKSRRAIAAARCRSEKTIDAQIDSIAVKLDAHSAVEIIAKAVAKNMVAISLRSVLICWLSFGVAANDAIEKLRAPNCRCRIVELTIRVREI